MTTVLTMGDFATVQGAERDSRTGPHVPLELTEAATQRYAGAMQEYGFTHEGQGQCSFERGEQPADDEWCLYTVVDDEVVITLSTFEEAREYAQLLQTGSLPTELEVVE